MLKVLSLLARRLSSLLFTDLWIIMLPVITVTIKIFLLFETFNVFFDVD